MNVSAIWTILIQDEKNIHRVIVFVVSKCHKVSQNISVHTKITNVHVDYLVVM